MSVDAKKILDNRPHIQEAIDRLYDKAIERTEGGRLFGREIDTSNPKLVIAALQSRISYLEGIVGEKSLL